MTKKSTQGSQNLRQRKWKAPTRNADKHAGDGKVLELIKKDIDSKNKANLQPWILGGIALIAMMCLATVSSPAEQGDSARIELEPLRERKMTEHTEQMNYTIARVISDYKVLQTFPHDTTSFTQGLTFRPDNSSILYESTGMYNKSSVRILDLNNNGQVLKEAKTPSRYFGEGLSYFRDEANASDTTGRLVHFTWREQTGFVIDLETLETQQTFSYTTTTKEGWGIIHVPNDNLFIVSDGSEYLHFWDMEFQEVKPKLKVTWLNEQMASQGATPKPLHRINELEWDPRTNTILANVWFQDVIVRIDPKTGHVLTIYNLRGLYTDRLPGSDVFNGIALSAQGDLWVTGKYWPYMYRIELGDA